MQLNNTQWSHLNCAYYLNILSEHEQTPKSILTNSQSINKCLVCDKDKGLLKKCMVESCLNHMHVSCAIGTKIFKIK
jgi:PHD-zinc-finger like domain